MKGLELLGRYVVRIGVIGFGRRIQSMIQEMVRLDSWVTVAAIVDVRYIPNDKLAAIIRDFAFLT